MPARWPTAKASAVAVQIAWAMKLLSSLMMWPAPGPADVEDVLGEGAQHRLEPGEGRAVGADHDVELAGLGLDRRARQRRVDEQSRRRRRRASRSRAVESGSLVEQSTMTSPAALAPASRPDGALDRRPRPAAIR